MMYNERFKNLKNERKEESNKTYNLVKMQTECIEE